MNNVEVLQHNFETIKPESIFTSIIQDEDMNKSIIDEIRKTGDVQDYKTNVKAYMTDWDMKGKPGFDKLEKIIIDMTKYLSKIYYNRKLEPRVSDMWGMIIGHHFGLVYIILRYLIILVIYIFLNLNKQ